VDDKRFWDLIAVGCPHDALPRDWHGKLRAELRKLDLDELSRYDHHFDELTEAADRRDLWSIADLVNGGASDDGFYYFRCWLVGMGKQVYEAALTDPDSLADALADFPYTAESSIYSAARWAWRDRGGADEEFDRAYQALGKLPRREESDEDEEEIDFYDPEAQERFPRLTALYHLDEEVEE
jgi:hypothetical protein